ncbi:sulfotransferase [Flavobacterium sp. W21_SRS_FM6]|uniref:tetratricopeptide repeat-containing sulfotransferase family protein n=1 Tax=Flavobacterium sp. W21_SRS_FM6 TaxID=3240268 RepID=UPI003F93A1B1
MPFKKSLRRLVDLQQFDELKNQALNYVLETHDLNAQPLLALAHAHLGERAKALDIVIQVKAQFDLLDLEARIDLAAVYCLLHQLEHALNLLEADYPQAPLHPLLIARLAWCRMAQGRLDEARHLYQQAAQLAPQRLPVWSPLCRLYLELQDYDSAQQALHSAIGQLEALHQQLPELVVKQFTAQFRSLQLELWVAQEQLVDAEQWLETRRHNLSEDEWANLVVSYASLLAGHDKHSAADEALRTALKHYANNLGLLSQLAELAQMQGRTQQTIQLLRRAIRLAKEQNKPEAGLWVRLSSTSLQHAPQQARLAAEKAIELSKALEVSEHCSEIMIRQLRQQGQNALAQVESHEQHFELAEQLFTDLLNDNPYFVPALQGLGQQQMQRGNIDEAVALFERIKQIDPAKGYASLINARHFPDDEASLQRIEQAARQPSLEGSVRAGLLLQLAASREKRKDYDQAFALAVEANNANKGLLKYDPLAHRNSCARIRYAFSRSLYEHRPDCGIDSTLPVYVLGMPRSGTTLVEQILAGHSEIFGAGELGIIPSRIQGLNRWERHVGSGRRYPDCVDDLSPYVSAGIANGIIAELQELAADDKPQAKHVVDKLPHNFENIGLIKFLLPQAKIISVRRDPRDIALSNYFTDYQAKHGGMGFAYDMSWIGEQLADHNMLMHHWGQVFPGEILEINYEDVVNDLEGSARKMLAYIGVEWEPQVVAFNEHKRPVKTASVWQVRQAIYTTSTAKWKRYQQHLAPLTQGTNKAIRPDPINDMLSLPEPGLFSLGVDLYRQKDLDGAELNFKKVLHHNPQHGAAHYMLALVYCSKGYVADSIPLFEHALQRCPWQQEWRDKLIEAYKLMGEDHKAADLQAKAQTKTNTMTHEHDFDETAEPLALLTSSAFVSKQE